MTIKKKLQVFVSSTYQDLREERQAAVEAILSSGHIPAGMELFTAGDQSQMHVIKRWIDESDVFLLILGGRYGSVEPETGKSYIHLEYEYALDLGKPLFAVVIEDKYLGEKVKSFGQGAIEVENFGKLKAFRQQVLSRLVRFWSDPRDIKLAIHETMAEFGRRTDVVGWIPGNQNVDTGVMAEELARLTRENAELRRQISVSSGGQQRYMGLTFNQVVQLLSKESIKLPDDPKEKGDQDLIVSLRNIAAENHRSAPTLIDALWTVMDEIIPKMVVDLNERLVSFILFRLEYFGIVEEISNADDKYWEFRITPDGQRFILRLIIERENVSITDEQLDA